MKSESDNTWDGAERSMHYFLLTSDNQAIEENHLLYVGSGEMI